jgi:6-phosphofructokinase 1
MCSTLRAGREIGRRANIVLVAEGARDVDGERVTAAHVRAVLEERLGEDARLTILGHVQRGGSPSAFDRYLGTVLGNAAVRQLLGSPGAEPQLIGIRGHHLTRSPLMECVEATRSMAGLIADRDFDTAMERRGGNFSDLYRLLRTIVQARPRRPPAGQRELRLAVLHAGGPAPGMNAAVRVAVRVGMERGHRLLGVRDGFRGLLRGAIEELDWMSVSGWVARPGAELGTDRPTLAPEDLPQIAAQLASHRVDGILLIGGWAGYVAAHELSAHADDHPGLSIPIVCIPASINNDLPGSDLSIGSDSALNSVVTDVDKIKESAVASHRCFIVEVMGHDCGYLALVGGLATGAEHVYLPEEGITLARMEANLESLRSRVRAQQTRRSRDPQRARGRAVHDALHRSAPQSRERWPVRRAQRDPRPRPARRPAIAIRPHPSDKVDIRRSRATDRPSPGARSHEHDGGNAPGKGCVHTAGRLPRSRGARRPAPARVAVVDGPATTRRHHHADPTRLRLIRRPPPAFTGAVLPYARRA